MEGMTPSSIVYLLNYAKRTHNAAQRRLELEADEQEVAAL